jgi:hypothetical protein
MRKELRVVVLACLAALVLVIPPAAQADDTTCGMEGNPAPFILPPGVHDNVVVPEGGHCWILGESGVIEIKGDVTAFPDSELLMRSVTVGGNVTALEDSFVRISALPGRTEIGGNVIGDKADYVELQFFGNIVHGNVHISGRGDVPAAAADFGTVICGVIMPNGSIEVEKLTVNFGIFVDNSFCSAPSFLSNGGIKVEDNYVLSGARLRVGEAQIANGNLHVFKNTGPGMKFVNNNNVSNGDIQCYENEDPFVGGPNIGRAPKSVIVSVFPLVVTAPNQCSGTSM